MERIAPMMMMLAEFLGLKTWNWLVILGLLVFVIILLIVRKRQMG